MKVIILQLCIFCLGTSFPCQAQVLYAFSLEGSVEGKDSGYVYLNYFANGDKGIIDSCKLVKGRFLIKGKISEPGLATFTTFNIFDAHSTVDQRNMAEFYIEPGHLKLLAAIDHFDAFRLAGSTSDNERMQLVKLKKGINQAEKPMEDAYQKYNDEYGAETRKGMDERRKDGLIHKLDSLRNQITLLEKQKDLIDSLFIVRTPNSYVAAEMLWQIIQVKTIKFPSLENFYRSYPRKIQESRSGKLIGFEIEKERTISVGRSAMNFIATDSKGDTIDLRAYKGKKFVLLDFGASWCLPCRQMTQKLKADYTQYGAMMEIISIANEDEYDAWQKAILEDKVEWPQIIENERKLPIEPHERTITGIYHINLLPSLVLIDKNFKIIGKYGGFYSSGPDAYTDLKTQLNSLFGK